MLGTMFAGPLPAEYDDLHAGATWSGSRRALAWMVAAIGRTKFVIAGAADDDVLVLAPRAPAPRARRTLRPRGLPPVRLAHRSKKAPQTCVEGRFLSSGSV